MAVRLESLSRLISVYNAVSYAALGLFLFSVLTACARTLPVINDHKPLSSIAKYGFAIDKRKIKTLESKQVQVWGYLDVHNIFLKPKVIHNQPEVWVSGGATRILLKARKSDQVGQGVIINIIGNPKQFTRLFNQLRDLSEISESPDNPVLVAGKLRTFAAPNNFTTPIGIVIDLDAPENIQILSNDTY